MDLHIRGNDIAVTDQMQALANRHAQRLERIVERVHDAKLELRKQSQRAGGEVTVAQLTLHTGRATLRAEERDRDAAKAIDTAFEKLERQVRKLHERKADHHGPRESESVDETDTVPLDGEDEPLKLVRTKRFQLKPMDLDEAIEQMELLGHDFFLFQNRDARTVNLIYRRRDGGLGLLVPELM